MIEYEISPDMQWAGPIVTLVQVIHDSDCGTRTVRTEMQAFEAADEALYGTLNGLAVRSAHIEYGPIIDRWGGSF